MGIDTHDVGGYKSSIDTRTKDTLDGFNALRFILSFSLN